MWPRVCASGACCYLFFISLYSVNTHELLDVTTVYKLLSPSPTSEQEIDVDLPIEIHMRTNALGMAPKTPYGVVEPETRDSGLLCDLQRTKGTQCDWALTKGFEIQYSSDLYGVEPTQSFEHRLFRTVTVAGCRPRISSRRYEQSGCRILIKSPSNKYFVKISLLSVEGGYCYGCNINRGTMYICRENNRGYSDDDLLKEIRPCTVYESKDFTVDMSKPITIEIEDSHLKIWEDGILPRLLGSLSSQTISPNTLHTIQTRSDPYYSDITIVKNFVQQTLQSTSLNSILTSPKIDLSHQNFCLLLIFNTNNTEEDQLSVSAVDSWDYEYALGTLHANKTGWQSWKLNALVHKNIHGKTVNILLKTLTARQIEIQRISTCNTQDKEEVSLITSEIVKTNSKTLEKQPYSTYYDPELAKNLRAVPGVMLTSSDCENGGVMTSAGCACPPGYTGPNCTLGCGPNRFGHDCGGQCSIYNSQCRGMLLCTAETGCNCAPGYNGPNCKQSCGLGTYGVNCRLRCAKCNTQSGECDIYTGLCAECAPGYQPPKCKEKYAHFKTAPKLSSTKYNTITVRTNFRKEHIAGVGDPMYYQLQYRLAASSVEWTTFSTFPIPSTYEIQEVDIANLDDATTYKIRAVLLVEHFNKYTDEDIPVAEIRTMCYIPDDYTYNITGMYYDDYRDWLGNRFDQTIVVTWEDFYVQEHGCPITSYDIWWREGLLWKHRNDVVSHDARNTLILSGVDPNQEVKFKLQANTAAGPASMSHVVKLSSPYKGLNSVVELNAENIQHNKADISWKPPNFVELLNFTYSLFYECVERPSCSLPCNSRGNLTTKEPNAVLGPLLPSAKYRVSVSANDGPNSYIYIGTSQSVPEEIPLESELKPLRTNSSATVFWKNAEVCTGFFESYHYQLLLAAEYDTPLIDSGKTTNTKKTFTNLQASTDYIVKVSVVSTGGWDPSNHLTINISTAATIPERVRNLTVYKRSRSMLGLRWAEPKMLYGALQSFTVSYSYGQGSEQRSVTLEPTHCSVWPDLYCHTLEGLKPVRTYNVTVKARNKDIHEDGHGVSVLGQTKEISPGSPENLMVMNITSTSLGLQWEHPNLTNGVLRSFLISIEETEQFDQDQCCQEYPIIEIAVNNEKKYYHVEVSGLHPASTYTISVTGKTVGFGPSQTITASTRPPSLPLITPTVFTNSSKQVTWLPQQYDSSSLNSSAEVYAPLIQSRILLVLSNTTEIEDGIEDSRLSSVIGEKISLPYYFVAEYNNESEEESLNLGEDTTGQSQWGRFSNPELVSGEYQLAAVQISEYNKVLNIDVAFSSKFVVS